jgi:hypothetical protein
MPQRCRIDGDPLLATLAEILEALWVAAMDSGDLDALMEKGGPERWARAYMRRTFPGLSAPVPQAADEARAFVAFVREWLEARGPEGVSRAERRQGAIDTLAYEPSAATVLSAVAYGWLASQWRAGVLGPTPGREVIPTMASEVEAAARRTNQIEGDVAAVARALLRGWGLPPAKAEATIKTGNS